MNKKSIFSMAFFFIALLSAATFMAARRAEGPAAPKTPPAAIVSEKPMPTEVLTLRVSGMGATMPIFSIFKVSLSAGGRTSVEKEYEATLDRPAAAIVRLQRRGKTLILSGGRESIYIFDEKNRRFDDKVLSFNDENGAAETVAAIDATEDGGMFAIALAGSGVIEVYDASSFARIASIAPAAGKCDRIMFLADRRIVFTASDRLSTGIFESREPYASAREISRVSLAASAFVALGDMSGFVIYNENSNAMISIDAKNSENKIVPPVFPPRAGAVEGISSMLPMNNDKFAMVRGDIGELSACGPSGRSGTSVRCDFMANSRPVVHHGGNLSKYAFLGSSKSGACSLVERETLEMAEKMELEGIAGLTAACLEKAQIIK